MAPAVVQRPLLVLILFLLACTAASEAKCCKVCRKGQPCGDACISRKLKCHKAPGCACAADAAGLGSAHHGTTAPGGQDGDSGAGAPVQDAPGNSDGSAGLWKALRRLWRNEAHKYWSAFGKNFAADGTPNNDDL